MIHMFTEWSMLEHVPDEQSSAKDKKQFCIVEKTYLKFKKNDIYWNLWCLFKILNTTQSEQQGN